MANSQLLAPWEYQGEIPQVVESGELLWNRRPVRFELLQVKRHAHAGVYDLNISFPGDDGSWRVVLSDSTLRSREEIQKNITKAAKKKWIRREFYIDSEVLRVQPDGTGYWHQKEYTMSDFHLGRSVANFTSSQTYDMILGLMAKTSSDVACALKFKKADFLEKRYRTFGFTSEEPYLRADENLRALCRLVVYSDTQVWKGKSRLRWSLQTSNEKHTAHFWSPMWPNNHWGSSWAKALERFGPITPHPKRLCVREYFKFDSNLTRGELAAPSVHEQLEARLELRAWAQENLPPDVRAEIELSEY